MDFESFVAWKHLTRRRKSGFISLISLISVAGVAVGVMALIVVLGVMSGFDRELKSKIVNVQPHLRIEKIGGVDDPYGDVEKIRKLRLPQVESVSPYIEGQAILRSDRNATGVLVKGLDLDRENVAMYHEKMVSGELDLADRVEVTYQRRFFFFKKKVERREGSIVLGQNLARLLGVRIGEKIRLVSPFKGESAQMSVRGIFRLGMNEFDTALALVDIERAQSIYRLGDRVTGISMRFSDVDQAQKWKDVVTGVLGPAYIVQSWYDMNQSFFQALKVEKSVMTILLALIILVAAFNIVSTLIMVVMEKTKDIGILRALGATRMNIKKIFVYQGFSVGFLGILVGTVTGLLVALNLNPITDFIRETTGIEIFPSDIYYFDRIPVLVHPEDVILIVSFALIASVLAGLFPASRAAKLDPIEALRQG